MVPLACVYCWRHHLRTVLDLEALWMKTLVCADNRRHHQRTVRYLVAQCLMNRMACSRDAVWKRKVHLPAAY